MITRIHRAVEEQEISMRRAARVDANQSEIVEALRGVGASVEPIHFVGRGVPDLLVGFDGWNFIMEIKDGTKPASQRRLTNDEAAWINAWRGTVHVIESKDQAIEIILRTRHHNRP